MISPTETPITARAKKDFDSATFAEPSQANLFFHNNACGNTSDVVDLPHERFSHYEGLLLGLRELDSKKYARMHKGTPFFFMAWLSFDLRNFEKAFYFLDAAVSEDILRAQDKAHLSDEQRIQEWIHLPAAGFLKLEQDNAAHRTIRELRDILEGQFARFAEANARPLISTNDWVKRFVEPLLKGRTGRTLLCAFYVFIYEYRDRLNEIRLRTGATSGGANHPFLSHLLLGGLVFESLLKQFYPAAVSLEQLFNSKASNSSVRRKFGLDETRRLNVGIKKLSTIETVASGVGVLAAFETTAQLRNATSHNLERDNIFDRSELYERLFSQVMNAIFYVVSAYYLT